MGSLWSSFNPLFVPEQIVLAKSHHVIFVTSILCQSASLDFFD